MNNPLDPTLRELNNCGCCAGTDAQTPAAIDNRPGLPAIRFRAGVHSQFKATLRTALSSQDRPALRALRTREDDDFTIALLDTMASMADILTFYAERIANEGYLRTATERRSVLDLGRAIGYELDPGVAARVMLSFTVESGAGATGTAIIPKGTKVQSIPGPGEKPQVYETSAEFTALAAWNELRPRLRAAPLTSAALVAATEIYLAGTGTNLKLGDILVLSDGTEANARRISKIEPDREQDHTKVTLEAAGGANALRAARAPAVRAMAALADMTIESAPTASAVETLFGVGVSSVQMYELSYFHSWDPLEVQAHLNSLPRVSLLSPTAGVFALRARAGFFGHNAPKWASLPKTNSTRNDAYTEDWDDLDAQPPPEVPDDHEPRPTKIWQDSQGNDLNPQTPTQFEVLLERPLPEVLANSWVVLESEGATLIPLRVGRNLEISRADYGMSGRCARLNLKNLDGTTDPAKTDNLLTTRGTTAHLQSEPMTVIGAPITTALSRGQVTLKLSQIDDAQVAALVVGQSQELEGDDADLPGTTQRESIVIAAVQTGGTTIVLGAGLGHNYRRATFTLNGSPVLITSDLAQGSTTLALDRIDVSLVIGQSLALKGENADLPGTTQREIIVIEAINHTDVTTLTLSEGLQHNYLRSTVTLNANVVPATHGETTNEILGNGDATQPFQRFTLKQKPLTYTLPPGGSKRESSLQIFVDNVRWTETSTFFGRGPKDRVYIVRLADDGTVTVEFGDGKHGARLPTGRENVRAVYRKGIGAEGIVRQDQIGLMLTQPLGVRGVSNLLAPEGAEDPQSLHDARSNAPRTVLTLDRIVSLQDYEDFARDFPAVDKADAEWTWSGQTRGVLLTLLGPGGARIAETGQPADPLRRAFSNQGIPNVPVRIVSRVPSLFAVSGTVRVAADRVPSVVEADVRAALLAAFSFEAREFGLGVHVSEVVAVIQNVPGVAFVDVTSFLKTALDNNGNPVPMQAVHGYLSAHKPINGADALLAEPAELLIIDETSLNQLVVTTL